MREQNDSTRARDHLANGRTFLAWMRTGLAVVVFGFAIGRFAIAIREFAQAQGRPERTAGMSVWLGVLAIVTGIVLTFAGLNRIGAHAHNSNPGDSNRLARSSMSWPFLR